MYIGNERKRRNERKGGGWEWNSRLKWADFSMVYYDILLSFDGYCAVQSQNLTRRRNL